jgi:hypothetical protein
MLPAIHRHLSYRQGLQSIGDRELSSSKQALEGQAKQLCDAGMGKWPQSGTVQFT